MLFIIVIDLYISDVRLSTDITTLAIKLAGGNCFWNLGHGESSRTPAQKRFLLG